MGILNVFDNFLDSRPGLLTLIFTIILIGLALGIAWHFEIKDIYGIIIIYSLIVIFLYAYGVLDFIWASSGFIAMAILSYFIFFKNKTGGLE